MKARARPGQWALLWLLLALAAEARVLASCSTAMRSYSPLSGAAFLAGTMASPRTRLRPGLTSMKGGKAGQGKPSQGIRKVCATNKFARSNYDITKTFEAGISLVGTEVGPVCGGSCQMRDSYCRVRNGELYIYNLLIGQHKTTGKYFNHEEKRPRRLLVHKKEILELKMESERSGFTIVPLRIYLNEAHRLKVEIGLGLGKKKYDKREAIKARELKRGFERILKSF